MSKSFFYCLGALLTSLALAATCARAEPVHAPPLSSLSASSSGSPGFLSNLIEPIIGFLDHGMGKVREMCPPVSDDVRDINDVRIPNDLAVESRHLIIFVHGLCGGGTSTWTATNQTGKPVFFFPKELAKDFKDSDVVSYSYISTLSRGFTIRGAARNLLEHIDDLLEEKRKRGGRYETVEFVAHSLGGLVVRYCLLNLYVQKDKPSRPDPTALVMLGTPNTGAGLASLAKHFANNPQISQLRPIVDNPWLDDFNDRWREAISGRTTLTKRDVPVTTYAGWETGDTVLGIIVNKASAIELADHSRELLGNHIQIAKPFSRNDPSYRFVRESLQDANIGYYEAEKNEQLILLAKKLASLNDNKPRPTTATIKNRFTKVTAGGLRNSSVLTGN